MMTFPFLNLDSLAHHLDVSPTWSDSRDETNQNMSLPINNTEYVRQQSSASGISSASLMELIMNERPDSHCITEKREHSDQEMYEQIVAELRATASLPLALDDKEPPRSEDKKFVKAFSHPSDLHTSKISRGRYHSRSPPTYTAPYDRPTPEQQVRYSSHPMVERPGRTERVEENECELRFHSTYCGIASAEQSKNGPFMMLGYNGRRKPEDLLRPYLCPVESCDLRYQWWRSLQHHLSVKHDLIRKKADYPQFGSLRT